MNHYEKLLKTLIFSASSFISLQASPCNTTKAITNLGISSGLNDYSLTITIPTAQGNETISLPPCQKGEWNPVFDCYCQDGKRTDKFVNHIQSTEFAPKIYGYNLNFSLKPTNQSNDIFCSRIMDSLMVIDYENGSDYSAFLLSAYKDQVLGILLGYFLDGGIISFNQMPCNVWNSIVEANPYNGQGRYPNCKNFTNN